MKKLLEFSLCTYAGAAGLLLAGGTLLVAMCDGWLCVAGAAAAIAGVCACAAALGGYLSLHELQKSIQTE